MKTILKFTTVLAVMLVSATVMATEPLINTFKKSVALQFDSKYEKTEIYLKDSKEQVIFSDFVSKGSHLKKFDFSKIENGTYYFVIDDVQEKIVYTITVNSDDVVVKDQNKYMKPAFTEKDNLLLVNFLNLDQSVIYFDVYDSNTNLILRKKLDKDIVVNKAFNFKKALKGNYTLVLRDSKNSYYKQIAVK